MAYGKTTGFLRCLATIRSPVRRTGAVSAGNSDAIGRLTVFALRRALPTLIAAFFIWLAGCGSNALALEPIVIGPDEDKIDITLLGEFYERRGDRLSVQTAAGSDGIAASMTVLAKTPGTNPSWVVFALSNPTDKPVARWLMAQRYDIVGSRVLKPELDAPR